MNNPIIGSHGTKYWCNEKNELHRIDGPAIEWPDGSKIWWVNSRRHRIDGPAVEYSDGSKEWWINNIDVSYEALNWYKDQGLDTNILLTTDEQILFKLKFG